MDTLFSPEVLLAFATLLLLEVVLGIDNVIFISILAGKLPEHQQAKARTIGLGLAMGMRILLLLTVSWIARLTTTLVELRGFELSGRDLILLGGGLFLIAKA